MWCIQGCTELKDLLKPNTNVLGHAEYYYYFHKDVTNDYLNSHKWDFSNYPQGEIISVEEFKFRYIDEFIVDCSNNTVKERQEVLKFLIEYRNYGKSYLNADYYPIIACNKKEGDSLYDCLVYTTKTKTFPNHKIYTFEEFKQKIKPSMVKKLNIGDTVTPIENLVYTVSGIKIEIKVVKNRKIKSFRNDNTHFQLEGDSSSWFFTKDFKKVEKKIIGYKLTKPEYRDAVAKIIESQNDFNNEIFDTLILDVSLNSYSIDLLKKAGVLDIWFEPVYEDAEKTISVGGKFNVVVRNKEIWHKSDNITTFVKSLCDSFKGTHNAANYTYDVKEVVFSRTGCQNVETKLSDWLKVLKEIE